MAPHRVPVCLALFLSCGAAAAQVSADAQKRTEYVARVAKIDAGDLGARCALARWCREQGLFTEMRREAGRVLECDPDHAGAREVLGQELVDGRWRSRAEAMQARGYVRYRGQWMRKYDAVKLQHAERQKRAQRELQHALDRHWNRLFSSSAATRDEALAALEDLAARREWADLRDAARRCHAVAERYWLDHPVVLATIRAQHSELLGLEPFTTSLGAGSPVTLQLPRLRTISVGTTVAVPAGRGR